jgi:hypothetical protein
MIVLALAMPAAAHAQTTPTTNDRGNAITGDIDGDISGDLGEQKHYRYKRPQNQQSGCYKDRNGNVLCK